MISPVDEIEVAFRQPARFSRIEDIVTVLQPAGSVQRGHYKSSGKIPIVDQGQSTISGFTDDQNLLIPEGQFVVFGDHTRLVQWVDFPFAAGADGVKILRAKEKILPKYLYYALTTLSIPNRGYNRHWTILRELKVPLPTLEIQRSIVHILDRFEALLVNLESEMEARRKQYEFYRNRLLSTHLPTGVEFKTVGELLGSIPRGKRLTKSNLAHGGSIPVFHGGMNPIGYHDESNTPGETVMVINTGASSGSVGWSNTPFWCSDGCFALPHSKDISPRFLYHYASLNERFFIDKVRKAGIPTLAAESILSLPIPVLPMSTQLEIAGTLDAFFDLTANQSIGLPAEIEARRKQFEYYRDLLLTFKDA